MQASKASTILTIRVRSVKICKGPLQRKGIQQVEECSMPHACDILPGFQGETTLSPTCQRRESVGLRLVQCTVKSWITVILKLYCVFYQQTGLFLFTYNTSSVHLVSSTNSQSLTVC